MIQLAGTPMRWVLISGRDAIWIALSSRAPGAQLGDSFLLTGIESTSFGQELFLGKALRG
jgi:hypothetical protein